MSENRIIAIGDIHGCADALNNLIEQIVPQSTDTLVILGDFIDRGPDTKYVIDLLIDLQSRTNLVTIQGNHEEMMLSALEESESTENVPLYASARHRWLQFGGSDTLESYDFVGDLSVISEAHRKFFGSMVDYYETDEFIFTHAAYQHDLPMEYQSVEFLRWYSLNSGYPPPHLTGKTCFVGHTSNKAGDIVDVGHLVCIDTYCYGGGWLTAIDAKSREIWQANIAGAVRSVEA